MRQLYIHPVRKLDLPPKSLKDTHCTCTISQVSSHTVSPKLQHTISFVDPSFNPDSYVIKHACRDSLIAPKRRNLARGARERASVDETPKARYRIPRQRNGFSISTGVFRGAVEISVKNRGRDDDRWRSPIHAGRE